LLKKLDILIIKAFIAPFLATFSIAVFIFTLQFFWVYLDDMVGKGLDAMILLKLIGFVILHCIPLVLPLAMLLSSIMTFGSLGETFEIVAIKSAGISLLRFMRPLVVVSTFITLLAFVLLNNVIPVAELKLETLKHDIIVKQPAFDIKEGVFYNKLRGFVIKIGKKEKDDSTIKNVVIFEANNAVQDNLITAESGVMRVTADQKFLEFILYNGCRYQEKGLRNSIQTDYIRMGFKQYSKLLDLSSLQIGKSNESSLEKNPKMLSVRQLDYTIDSIKRTSKLIENKFTNNAKSMFDFVMVNDKGWLKKDTFKTKNVAVFNKLIPDSIKSVVYQNSLAAINNAIGNSSILTNEFKQKTESLRTHEIEWHKRFTYSIACLLLFFIGAPLGSIIRKGGLGTPLIFAIVFFAIFYLLNTFGEKFSKEHVLSSFAGIWLSTAVLLPIAVFLIYKASKDSQLFNNEFYFRLFRKIKQAIANLKN